VLYQLSYLGAAPAGRRAKESAGGYRDWIPDCPDGRRRPKPARCGI
jgi:hypothetical protein